MDGTKTFEIRKNDRGYKVGDKIVFKVVSNEGLAQKYVALAISKED